MRASTSIVALAIAIGVMLPVGASAQGMPELFKGTDGMWFVSVQGDLLALDVPLEVATLGDFGTSTDWVSQFNKAFGGNIAIGRKVGQWDMSVALAVGAFSADPVLVDQSHADTPYGELDHVSSGSFALGTDTSSFIAGNLETGYTLPSETGAPKLRLFGGVKAERFVWNRYVEIDTSTDGNIEMGNETSTFVGVGPSIGVGVELPLDAAEILTLFSSASGGVLLGNLTRTEDVNAVVSESSFAMVPFASAEVGITLGFSDALDFSLGYQASLRDNVISNRLAQGSGSDIVQSRAITHGAFARLTAYFE